MDIEEARKAAKLLATRPAKSMEGMHSEDRVNGIEQMLLDLRQLAESDGCIAAAWAYELAIDVAAELARRETEAAERAMPITEEWIKSIGALSDEGGGLSFKIWEKGQDEHTEEPAFQVLCASSGVWLECYDTSGSTLGLVELPLSYTRGPLAFLLSALKGGES